MAVGNPVMQRMLSERRAALGLPVRDPQESDPTRQQPSNPTDYFENIERNNHKKDSALIFEHGVPGRILGKAPKHFLKTPSLQENSGILTDIPENEILGISRGISEEIPRKHKIGFPRNFLGIYRRNSEEISIRRNIPRKFRGKMGSSEKTDEFRGNIIAVGEPLGDFTKFRGNSD
ncbi:hypothetical protein YC2023_054063 [Brassica napus]